MNTFDLFLPIMPMSVTKHFYRTHAITHRTSSQSRLCSPLVSCCSALHFLRSLYCSSPSTQIRFPPQCGSPGLLSQRAEIRVCGMMTPSQLTCSLGHHQLGFAASAVPLGGVGCYGDGVGGVWLQASNDHLLQFGDRRKSQHSGISTRNTHTPQA